MKPIHFLPPVAALVVAATWLGIQRHSMAVMKHDNLVLQQHLAAARATAAIGDLSRATAEAPDQTARDKRPIDWRKIAGQFADMQNGGLRDLRTMMRFQTRIQAMTQQELVAALDEIATLDLPAASRAMLEQMLIGPLIQKDPEFALTRFIDRLQDDHGSVGWQLSHALQEWAKKDVTKASAWFDQQIAAGKFDSKTLDGKSQSRLRFEGNLIGVLLASDPAAAARRLGALPADQRAEALGNSHGWGSPAASAEDQLAMAKLVRDQVPAKDQTQIFGQQASRLVAQGGYAKVTEYLDRIAATPAERDVCVEQAATGKLWSNKDKLAREDLDAMRTWAATQAPDATDRVTGKVLASAMQGNHKLEFAEAAGLAVQYGRASGTDEVLGTFLESWPARNNKEQARALAAQIGDEKRRAQILRNLQ